VILVDWPIFSSDAIKSTVKVITSRSEKKRKGAKDRDSSSRSSGLGSVSGSGSDLDLAGLEVEGTLFFDHQPVALLAVEPSYVHPLMDAALFRLLHRVPSLQLVLAVRETFFSHSTSTRHRMVSIVFICYHHGDNLVFDTTSCVLILRFKLTLSRIYHKSSIYTGMGTDTSSSPME